MTYSPFRGLIVPVPQQAAEKAEKRKTSTLSAAVGKRAFPKEENLAPKAPLHRSVLCNYG